MNVIDWYFALNLTRPVNFIGLSRFLQTVSSYQDNTDNVEIGNCPLRSTRNQQRWIHLETYSVSRNYPTPRSAGHGGKNRAIPSWGWL